MSKKLWGNKYLKIANKSQSKNSLKSKSNFYVQENGILSHCALRNSRGHLCLMPEAMPIFFNFDTYHSSETIKIRNEVTADTNTSLADTNTSFPSQNIGSIDDDTSFSNAEEAESLIEMQSKVLNNDIHGGGDNINIESESSQVLDEFYTSKTSEHENNLEPSLQPNIDVSDNKTIEENVLEKRHEIIQPNDEIYPEKSKLLDLSTSGEESDIEDDATTKGKNKNVNYKVCFYIY